MIDTSDKYKILQVWNYGEGHEAELAHLLSDIRRKGQGRDYDCILGLSGGLDSCYMLHLAVKSWGLRPYVLHIDCGWDLPVAQENMRCVCEKLGIELHVKTMNWEEMREMQKAFFRTGLSCLDHPQDHCFIAVIDECARTLGVKYILNGYNICTELFSNPRSWFQAAGYAGDGSFVKAVCRKYCDIPIRDYVFTSGLRHKIWMPYVWGIKTVNPLNLVPLTKRKMTETLTHEYGFTAYGQKHFEDMLTKFLEGWWHPTRFGYDTREVQTASLVMTGQMTQEEAEVIMQQPALTDEEASELFAQVAQKLEVSEKQMKAWHDMPMSTETFRSQRGLYQWGIKVFTWLGLEKRIRSN